jgi:hypothetical protein
MSKDDLAKVDNLEVEALSDEELDSVAGGSPTEVASCTCCADGSKTTIVISES